MPGATFNGFPASTIKFLRDLASNNDRAWFDQNRDRYESAFLEPSLAFIAAMAKPLGSISKEFCAVPKKSGGSLMRIFRDTRFAKDKSPYKTNIGIQLRHSAGKDVHAPGFYFHIEPKSVFLGVGLWHPDAKPLAAIRKTIQDDPKAWRRVRDGKRFNEHFRLAGESLKRPPRGFDPDHPEIEDLKRKDFMAIRDMKVSDVKRPDIVADVTASLRASKPFMRFLCDAIGLPF